MSRARTYLHALLCMAAGACAAADETDQAVHQDSTGVQITESVRPAWSEGDGWTVDAEPVLDLSESAGASRHDFFQVRNAIRLPDGGIAVSNSGTNEVHLFDDEGRFVLAAGGAGQGPGEFERLTTILRYRGDSLLAFDSRARRITVLGPDGQVARVASLNQISGSLSELYPFPDGRLLLHTHDLAALAGVMGRVRVPAPLLLLGADGVEQDTVAVVPGHSSHVFDQGDAAPPLRHETFAAVRDSLVYVGDAESLSFRVLGRDGRLRRIARVPGYDLDVPASVRDSMAAALLQQDIPEVLRQVYEDMAGTIPSRRPAYSGLLVDPEGFVWAAEYTPSRGLSPGPRRWLVFDPTGVWLGSVDLPANFDLYEVGTDYVLGRSRNDLEVETVQLLRLERG